MPSANSTMRPEPTAISFLRPAVSIRYMPTTVNTSSMPPQPVRTPKWDFVANRCQTVIFHTNCAKPLTQLMHCVTRTAPGDWQYIHGSGQPMTDSDSALLQSPL